MSITLKFPTLNAFKKFYDFKITIDAFEKLGAVIVILISGILFVLVKLSFYLKFISLELKDMKWKKI